MTSTKDEYEELFNVYWPVGVVVLVLIWVLIVLVAVRYRDRGAERGVRGGRGAGRGTYVEAPRAERPAGMP